MIKKVIIGTLVGCLIGLFTTSFFLPKGVHFRDILLTKITATSIIVGFLSGIYAHLSKSKLQVFLVSILIGMLTFYLKYIITGHDFDPLTMGAFTGALLGGVFAIIRKTAKTLTLMRRLRRRRKSGFNRYGY